MRCGWGNVKGLLWYHYVIPAHFIDAPLESEFKDYDSQTESAQENWNVK